MEKGLVWTHIRLDTYVLTKLHAHIHWYNTVGQSLALSLNVLRDIKLIISVYVFKYTPWEFPSPKNNILPKPEVNHKKVNIDIYAIDIAFKLD